MTGSKSSFFISAQPVSNDDLNSSRYSACNLRSLESDEGTRARVATLAIGIESVLCSREDMRRHGGLARVIKGPNTLLKRLDETDTVPSGLQNKGYLVIQRSSDESKHTCSTTERALNERQHL